MEERYRSVVCVDIVLKQGDKILLMKRQNTGNDDGYFELPGGHLEKKEDIFNAMLRELEEELCIKLERKDIKLVHILHHYTGDRINFIFECNKDNLNPVIGEPNKCSEINWFSINHLPKNTTEKVKKIIENVINNKEYDTL